MLGRDWWRVVGGGRLNLIWAAQSPWICACSLAGTDPSSALGVGAMPTYLHAHPALTEVVFGEGAQASWRHVLPRL